MHPSSTWHSSSAAPVLHTATAIRTLPDVLIPLLLKSTGYLKALLAAWHYCSYYVVRESFTWLLSLQHEPVTRLIEPQSTHTEQGSQINTLNNALACMSFLCHSAILSQWHQSCTKLVSCNTSVDAAPYTYLQTRPWWQLTRPTYQNPTGRYTRIQESMDIPYTLNT